MKDKIIERLRNTVLDWQHAGGNPATDGHEIFIDLDDLRRAIRTIYRDAGYPNGPMTITTKLQNGCLVVKWDTSQLEAFREGVKKRLEAEALSNDGIEADMMLYRDGRAYISPTGGSAYYEADMCKATAKGLANHLNLDFFTAD